jgi:hypothetical protein
VTALPADEITDATCTEEHHRNTLYCSFCSKCQHDAALLIVGGPHAFICDECVDACAKVVLDHRRGIFDQLDEIRLLGT